MTRTIYALEVLWTIVTLMACSSVLAQQIKTFTQPDGSKDIFSTATGWTETDKSGKAMKMSAPDLTRLCKDMEDTPELLDGKSGNSTKIACDEWAKLQPRTQMEQVPFLKLITRLLLITPTGTDFERYRGVQLRSDGKSVVYDATLVPNDLGENVSCEILQSTDSESFNSIYRCSIKTLSYPAAIAIEKMLVKHLTSLHLDENRIAEHGILEKDKYENECAPTGECAHAAMYISISKDNKVLSIDATPDFIRNGVADIQMLTMTGRHTFVERISPDSGTVDFSIYSFRPATSRLR